MKTKLGSEKADEDESPGEHREYLHKAVMLSPGGRGSEPETFTSTSSIYPGVPGHEHHYPCLVNVVPESPKRQGLPEVTL